MQASAEKIWQAAQQVLRTTLNPDIYNLWFHPLKAVMLETDTLTLEVGDDFCEVWLKDNYAGLLRDVLSTVSSHQMKVKFMVANGAPVSVSAPRPAEEIKAKAKISIEVAERSTAKTTEGTFNPKNTFDTFVVGENNNHAHAAAQAVASAPGQILQPAVPSRRRRSGQDSPAPRYRPARRQSQERRARDVFLFREIHERIHRRHPK